MKSVAEDTAYRFDRILLTQWERNPEYTAIVDGDEAVTYRELRARVVHLAGVLRERGIGPGVRAAVYLERSVDFVVSILGVIFAGGSHIAFEVNDPPHRSAQMMEDCTPRLLITSPALRHKLPEDLVTEVVTIDECVATRPKSPLDSSLTQADQPALMIYTSGSTGHPKASVISHRALSLRLSSLQRAHPIDENDRIIHHTSCSFDGYLVELYWPLMVGATVVIASPRRHRDADYLAELISSHEITTFYCVVSLLDLFLLARDPAERYDGLRQVLTGGEQLSKELVKKFYARSTASLTNIYGPSECTIYCTEWECPRDPELETVLIGSAIEDTSLWILDADGRPVPDGEAGELYIGGPGIALGYLNRSQLTAERFVSDHLGGSDGRLYRSGDLVMARPNGELEFLGRMDRQVKIRGFRIELGEIESVAMRCDNVRQAATVAHGSGHDTRLVTLVVGEPGADSSHIRADVYEACQRWLPQHMVPAAVLVVDSFPLTSNGKLDRSLMTEWAAAAVPATTADQDRPAAGLESAVADIWCEVLGVPSIGRHDDFFDVGGNSFNVVRVVEELESRMGIRVAMSVLLFEPTLAEFTEALSGLQS
jgi:amino acid adenylation domain-containing protein